VHIEVARPDAGDRLEPGVGVPEWYAVEVALADVILPEGMP